MKPFAAWDRFLYAPASGHRIAAFRILFALYMLGYLGALLPHVTLLFSNQGVYIPYRIPDIAPAPSLAWPLFIAMFACVLALLLGYRTELAARVLLVLFLYHYFLQLAVKQSVFERLIGIDVLVLCFADSGRVWGLDARRAGAAPNAWAERVLAAQSVFLYSGSGLWKLSNPAWHSGALLRSTLQSVWATPFGFALVRHGFSDATWTAFSWTIIVFEVTLGPLLLWRPSRPFALALGTLFHALNCVVLVIPEFLVSVAPYPVFVEPATLQRWGAAVARLRGRAFSRLRAAA
jgi:vitamin K-dependent gamma-carboxylase